MKICKLGIIKLLLILVVFSFTEINAKKTKRFKTYKVRRHNTTRIVQKQSIEVQTQEVIPQQPSNPIEIQETKKEAPWYETVKLGAMIRIRPEAKYNYDFDKFKNDNISFVGTKAQIWIEKEFTENTKVKINL